MKYAIIGGTGVYEIPNVYETREVDTIYGTATVDLIDMKGETVVFLPRHGDSHNRPPHSINYKANIMALKTLGVECIYTTGSVGSCNILYEPGDILIVRDFIDFTKSRDMTFLNAEDNEVKHLEMRDPYCKNLRDRFYSMAKKEGLLLKGNAIYGCTEGPRFETASEILMYENLGADIIGMTTVPEVILAKELGMCYATIAIVTNWTTGYTEESSRENIQEIVEGKKEIILNIFMKVFEEGFERKACKCNNSIISFDF